ncbi:MAG: alpha/beta hydrolase [Acidobacteriia bacterium]|nr:alpha/beta hydrolase [Terriglobia bacterium]
MRYLLPFLFAAMAAAQGQDPPFRLPEGVEKISDLVYAAYGGRQMHLDLYIPKTGPKTGNGPFPVVIYIHGGAWKNGNKNAFARQAAHMATKGVVGACIEYRLSGEAKWPAAIYDSKAAVRWVRANASKYNLDPERIGAAGGSAGGHLVALLGTTHHRAEMEGPGGNPGKSSRVIAVAAFNPAVDLVSLGKKPGTNANTSVAKFLGKTYAQDMSLWELATPITHVSKRSASFLFLHGASDATVPYRQSLDMQAKLKEAGVRAELFTAEGAGHGFFNRPPWFAPTQQRMEEFFLRVFSRP